MYDWSIKNNQAKQFNYLVSGKSVKYLNAALFRISDAFVIV